MNIFVALKKYNKIFNREQKMLGILVLFLSMIGAIWETLGVSVIVPFADVLLSPEESLQKEGYINIVKWFQLKSGTELIVFLAVVVALIYVIKNMYFILLSWVRAKYSAKIERELSVKAMENYMARGYSFFTDTNTGTLLRSIQTDVTNANMFLFNAMKLVTDIMVVFFIAAYIIFVDWQLAIGVGIMCIVCFVLIAIAFSKVNLRAGENSREYLAKSNQVLLQALQGVKEVLVLKKEPFFVDAYRKSFAMHMKANCIRVVCSEIPAYIIEASCVAVIFAIICIRVLNVGITDALLPTLASFIVAAFRILPTVGKLTSEYSAMNYYYAGVDAVYSNFQEISESNAKNELIAREQNAEKIVLKQKISIEDIVFSYGGENIISHLNMEIKKGEAVAFIGPSGSGKTTLSDIVLGLLKPQQGQIFADDKNIALYPNAWSNIIGYVSQTMYLADETIRFNVAFGVEEQNIDDERVWECLKKAHIEEYVRELKEGIYTVVGDRGVKFSGGQRQRIAIARALYHNPQVLVLDEATSALDNNTENEVMESIEELQGEITLIIVAHRLSTIKKCDRIFEIINGVAIEKNKEDMEIV